MALFLLGTATAGIAFLPGYVAIGATSIVLLALFRVLQGLALGGSWDGLPSLLALNAPKQRRGWYAMLGQLGAPVGFIVAAALFAFLISSLSPTDFFDWGWRYPFYAAFAINVVALFARLRLVVAKEYEQELGQHELEPVPLAELVREKGRHVLIGAFAPLASFALFHIVTIFPLSWILLREDQPIVGFLWVQVLGGWGRFDADGNAAKVDQDMAGFLARIADFMGLDSDLPRPLETPRKARMGERMASFIRSLSLLEQDRGHFLELARLYAARAVIEDRQAFEALAADPAADQARWQAWMQKIEKRMRRALAADDKELGQALDLFDDYDLGRELGLALDAIEAQETRAMADRFGVDLTPWGYGS